MPLRILVISNLYPDERQPTFGTFIRTHVDALRQAGAEVQLAAIRGVAVHAAVARKYARLWLASLGFVVSAMLRRRPPDVVEAHIAYPTGIGAWPLARLAGARLVLYSHGGDVMQVGRRSRLHRALARFILRRADMVVANSQFIRGVLIADYGLPADRIVVSSPGIDVGLFRSTPEVARRPNRILYVGRLDPEKGVDVLIEAIAELGAPRTELRIVGTGRVRQELETLARRRRVPAEFVGGLRPPEVATEMASAAVLVVPSVYQEPLGLVALEGMASGAVVVASRAGGLAETVEHGRTGWLVEPGDAGALAVAIREALALVSRGDGGAEALRAAARRRAADHDVNEIAKTTVAWYRRLTSAAASD